MILSYNVALVTLGATLLGIAAGVTGTFLFLRKRALVSDAISHATLPGVALAFIVMVALGQDGRWLPGLLVGSALTAALGLFAVSWLVRATRLGEDAAIGAVLSVSFGAGIVLLTVIQTMDRGRAAGLDGFLLGSTAGMLRSDAVMIAAGGAAVLALVALLHRPMLMVAFDAGYARSIGVPDARIDLAIMGLVLAVTVTGLKIVGLILIVALLIIPPVAARFWSDRAGRVALIAGGIGGASGAIGAVVSGLAPGMPTGPIVVLVAFAAFVVSLFLAPGRGVLAVWIAHRQFQRRVHVRQGLLALGQGHPVYEPLARRYLVRAGLARPDGVPTDAGAREARAALRDEDRWSQIRASDKWAGTAALYDGLRDIRSVLTPDQIAEVDRAVLRDREGG